MIPHIVRRVELTDLHAVVALCAEHAEFERASFDVGGGRKLHAFGGLKLHTR